LTQLFPQLEIFGVLGRGGMGIVYKARQTRLDRLVALKILPADAGRDPAFAERFLREARALARLSHPHIVAVHDFGEAGGIYHFVMEFVEGGNLRQRLRAGPVAPAEVFQIVAQICDALQYAHEEGVVHRDVKPENILLDRRGRVKIADFGLAKLLGRTPAGLALTASQHVMGTLNYMAPEQMETPLRVDHRADIYSLGVVFYELLTGELPLGRFAPPSQKVRLDPRADEVVLRALEKEPGRRYQYASELRRAIESLGQSPPPVSVPPVASSTTLPQRTGDAVSATDPVGGPAGSPVLSPAKAILRRRLQMWAAVMLLLPGILAWAKAALFFLACSDGSALLRNWFSIDPFYAPRGFADYLAFLVLVMGLTRDVTVGLIGVMFLHGAILLQGWRKMRRVESYWFLVFCGLTLMVPLLGNAFMNIPLGIWLLVVLTRPEVIKAFQDREALGSSWDPVPRPGKAILRRRLQTLAAVTLLATGVAAWANAVGLLIWFNTGDGNWRNFYGYYWVPALLLLQGAILGYGWHKMRRLEAPEFLVICSIIGMLPISYAAVLGIPFGIWTLVVLTRPEVIEVFEDQKAQRNRVSE
jgi:hypothetical protein